MVLSEHFQLLCASPGGTIKYRFEQFYRYVLFMCNTQLQFSPITLLFKANYP